MISRHGLPKLRAICVFRQLLAGEGGPLYLCYFASHAKETEPYLSFIILTGGSLNFFVEHC